MGNEHPSQEPSAAAGTCPPPAIDAVITWVDGDDPRHLARRLAVSPEIGSLAGQAATFRSLGEVGYCVRALLRFAPFLRRIHIVTDDQTPSVIAESALWPAAAREKVSVVDHRDIFAGQRDVLPTFNSLAIETMLHRIPGLAEQFVYFNDDVMLIRPARIDDWFRAGVPVLRGRWWIHPDRRPFRRLRAAFRRIVGAKARPRRAGFNAGQVTAARLLGYETRYFAFDHHPHPLRRSTFERFFAERPDVLRANILPRLRDPSQYNPIALAGHLELQAGTAHVEAETRLVQLPPRVPAGTAARRLRRAAHDPRALFVNVQSLESADEMTRTLVIDWWDRVIGRDLVGPGADLPSAPAGCP